MIEKAWIGQLATSAIVGVHHIIKGNIYHPDGYGALNPTEFWGSDNKQIWNQPTHPWPDQDKMKLAPNLPGPGHFAPPKIHRRGPYLVERP